MQTMFKAANSCLGFRPILPARQAFRDALEQLSFLKKKSPSVKDRH